MRIRLSYFALLRERAGKNEEAIETSAKTAKELYQDLSDRYRFGLDAAQVKFVINDCFEKGVYILKDGDHVIFIVPVSGG